ncbi:sulfite exporter TauE/SafE family protein [Pontivivens insulae]|uniref:Probable membrane transporter protein n=1 Tax=Pontivivens insulae TaxID=1639689 RepID=A0A2R8AD99_9RHOB|nr:sulfite exporter TauE/SafE family protein [Pontivivens insulae]RED14138.1 hypothetical protein DFR53_1493 [Pontivivens insulae]SPF30214.1 hypothetical protein POI8812_02549 [Pontivivens insulae]
MPYDLTFYLIAIPAAIFAGVSKGGFGSGPSFASAIVLALILPPREAIGVMLPVLMAIDAATLKPYWKKWNWREGRGMMVGMVPGVAAAALVFGFVNDDALRLMIGAVAIGFVLFQLAKAQGWITVPPRPFSALVAAIWGAAAGFTSFVSHAGGPPASMYLLGRGLSKLEYQATTVLVFWWVNVLKFGPYALLGMFSAQGFLAAAVIAPFAIAGAFWGVYLNRIVSERAFFTITYVMLTATGAKLIWDAIV